MPRYMTSVIKDGVKKVKVVEASCAPEAFSILRDDNRGSFFLRSIRNMEDEHIFGARNPRIDIDAPMFDFKLKTMAKPLELFEGYGIE